MDINLIGVSLAADRHKIGWHPRNEREEDTYYAHFGYSFANLAPVLRSLGRLRVGMGRPRQASGRLLAVARMVLKSG